MAERTQGTDPSAEEPAKKQRRDDDHQGPEQSAVECAGGEHIGKSYERVRLEKEAQRGGEPYIASRVGRSAKFRPHHEQHEEQKEGNLEEAAEASQCGIAQGRLRPAKRTWCMRPGRWLQDSCQIREFASLAAVTIDTVFCDKRRDQTRILK